MNKLVDILVDILVLDNNSIKSQGEEKQRREEG